MLFNKDWIFWSWKWKKHLFITRWRISPCPNRKLVLSRADAKVVSSLCPNGAVLVPQWCCSGATLGWPWCFTGAALVLYWCHAGVQLVPRCCWVCAEVVLSQSLNVAKLVLSWLCLAYTETHSEQNWKTLSIFSSSLWILWHDQMI